MDLAYGSVIKMCSSSDDSVMVMIYVTFFPWNWVWAAVGLRLLEFHDN